MQRDSAINVSAGQILWPAAELLAGYLAANPAWTADRRCAVELGAGLGLVGCVAARSCHVVLTDHNADVLSVLQRNADLNRHRHGELAGHACPKSHRHWPVIWQCSCESITRPNLKDVANIVQDCYSQDSPHVCGSGASCMLLDWTSAADIATVKAASPGGRGFDLVLGADVAYGQQALPALFTCAAALLQHTPDAAFLLGERGMRCATGARGHWPADLEAVPAPALCLHAHTCTQPCCDPLAHE